MCGRDSFEKRAACERRQRAGSSGSTIITAPVVAAIEGIRNNREGRREARQRKLRAREERKGMRAECKEGQSLFTRRLHSSIGQVLFVVIAGLHPLHERPRCGRSLLYLNALPVCHDGIMRGRESVDGRRRIRLRVGLDQGPRPKTN